MAYSSTKSIAFITSFEELIHLQCDLFRKMFYFVLIHSFRKTPFTVKFSGRHIPVGAMARGGGGGGVGGRGGGERGRFYASGHFTIWSSFV